MFGNLEVRDQTLEDLKDEMVLQSPPYLPVRYDETKRVTNKDQSSTTFRHPKPDNLGRVWLPPQTFVLTPIMKVCPKTLF